MPSPAALEQWAAKQYDDTAAHFDDPGCRHDWQIQMHTKEGREAIPIVQQLLQDNIDASKAASEFANICKARLLDPPDWLERNRDDFTPQGLWWIVCSVIEHFADDETGITCAKLADLLLELSKIELRKVNGDVVKSNDGRKYWSDLPLWNLAFRDHMTTPLGRGSYVDRDEWVIAWCRQLQNGALFNAYWLGHYGDTTMPRSKMTVWTLEHFREALERSHEDSDMGRRRTEIHVVAAMHWITEAGATVLRFCREEYRRDGTQIFDRWGIDEGTDGYIYTGDDGFYMARWALWKAGFRRVAATEGIDPDVAAKAAATADEMDRLERSEPDQRPNGGP